MTANTILSQWLKTSEISKKCPIIQLSRIQFIELKNQLPVSLKNNKTTLQTSNI